MSIKRRVLTDEFKEYNTIRKGPAFPHLMKKAKLEKAEGSRVLKKFAEKRMRFLLNSLYPEMSAERRQRLVNKFRDNTGFMNLPYRIVTVTARGGVYNDLLEHVRITKNHLNDRASLMNVLDHEAVHFLNDEFKRFNFAELEEFIATGIHSSILPEKTGPKEPKGANFPNPGVSFPLKNERMGKEFSNAKTLKEMKINPFSDHNLPSPSLIRVMSGMLGKNLDLKTRNQFLRDTMDGKNPVISFNDLMKQKGIQAVIEGKQITIKKVKP